MQTFVPILQRFAQTPFLQYLKDIFWDIPLKWSRKYDSITTCESIAHAMPHG